MKVQMAYCSACDRDVRVAFPEEPAHDAQANVPDAEVVCLEIGHQCTGSMCPIGATPPAVMAVRLVRSGLPTLHPVQMATCDVCGDVEKFALINAQYATCIACGRTVQRSKLATPTSN